MHLQPLRQRLRDVINELEQNGEYIAASHASMALDALAARRRERSPVDDTDLGTGCPWPTA